MIQIKKASLNEIRDLLEIENDSFDGKEKFDENYFLYNISENELARTLILYKDHIAASYLIYWITFDSSTIISLATKRNFRNNGFACQLLEKMFEDLKENNVETCTLEVRKSNIAAINLYEKLDFVYCNTKKDYYENPIEDALYYVKGV